MLRSHVCHGMRHGIVRESFFTACDTVWDMASHTHGEPFIPSMGFHTSHGVPISPTVMCPHTHRRMSHGMNNRMARCELRDGPWGVIHPMGCCIGHSFHGIRFSWSTLWVTHGTSSGMSHGFLRGFVWDVPWNAMRSRAGLFMECQMGCVHLPYTVR